jgi:hypothetical protein
MSLTDDVAAILDLENRPVSLARIVVIADGADAVIVQCDPPGHYAAGVVLEREVALVLRAAGFQVEYVEQPLPDAVVMWPSQARHPRLVPLVRVRRAD